MPRVPNPTEIIDHDVLVVGGGPAGLFASLALLADGADDVLIIDAGPDVDDRRRASDLRGEVGGGEPDYESGIGGAGLFSDGKLCLSLDVGGKLEASIGPRHRGELLAQIEGVFRRLVDGEFQMQDVTDAELRRLDRDAVANDLRFKYYPVAHIGTDRCGDVIVELRRILEAAGATIRARTELIDIAVDGESKIASLRSGGTVRRVRAKKVVLAMGKVGAGRQASLCRGLGMSTQSLPMYVGVRLETDAKLLDSLFSATKDPKYSALMADGSKVKTHCASEQGEVIELHYSGLPLAGGHNYSHAQTERSGFSILWDGFVSDTDGYRAATEIMRAADRLTAGHLLAQRISDYRSGLSTSTEDLAALELSCSTAIGGDVRQILPPGFFAAMDTLLERLEKIDTLAPRAHQSRSDSARRQSLGSTRSSTSSIVIAPTSRPDSSTTASETTS